MPVHTVFDWTVFYAGRRARTARTVLVDHGQNVRLALPLIRLTIGLRLVFNDLARYVLFDARRCVGHFSPLNLNL